MTNRFDFVSLGETMIRLSPPNFERISQARSLDIQIGGAESNVAVAMARLGFKPAWLSRMPDNGLGRRVAAELNFHGVDTSGIKFVPNERIGTYFIELAVPPRPNRVIYDRADSAASKMTVADVAFDVIEQSRWLHTTGITSAISAGGLDVSREIISFAKQRGITTSFDVNYRALLWGPKEAGAALEPIFKHCDYVFTAHRDAVSLFGANEEPHAAARELRERFGCGTLVVTIGEAGAIAQHGDQQVEVNQRFKVPQIVDRIGAGDAFDAGFIAAQMWGRTIEESIDYGNALSAMKLTVPGDLSLTSREELEAMVGGAKGASIR